MKKTVALLAIAILAFLGGVFQFRSEIREAYRKWERGPVPPTVSRQEAQQAAGEVATNEPANAPKPAPTDTNTNPVPKPATNTNAPSKPAAEPTPAPVVPVASTKPTVMPKAFNLSVLFVPQAPHKVWDAKHEDACEEASMLMLQAYLNDTASMSLDEMEKRITDIMAYETKELGPDGWISITGAETAAVMRDFLGIKSAKAVKITSIDDVKREIAKGFPVALPAAGRLLYNPNFKNGGPVYHMLVAKGYTETAIITNDPGTRLGADYAYKNDVLWNAIHDWNGGDVVNGGKVMIVAE